MLVYFMRKTWSKCRSVSHNWQLPKDKGSVQEYCRLAGTLGHGLSIIGESEADKGA